MSQEASPRIRVIRVIRGSLCPTGWRASSLRKYLPHRLDNRLPVCLHRHVLASRRLKSFTWHTPAFELVLAGYERNAEAAAVGVL